MRAPTTGLPLPLRNALISARRAKDLTQAQLGKLVGLPQMHISGIETGRVIPRYDTLLEIVRVLEHDLLFVPRDLVPVVQALLANRNRKPDADDLEDRALYQPEGDNDDQDAEQHP